MAKRANKEGSIFPYRNGYAAYVWVDTPDGDRKRKWAYGKTREEVHTKWLKLHQEAARGPVATKVPKLAEYLSYWLKEVIQPNKAPATFTNYEMFVRLYISPKLGHRRLDKLSVREVQKWINDLAKECQCCTQGKDAAREPGKRRCCAAGECCEDHISDRTAKDALATLRNGLNNAIRSELISRNVAELVETPKVRRRREKPWSVEDARRFLEAARRDDDPLYLAYVLVLVLGFRRGEALGVWEEGIRWDGWERPCGEHTVAFCPDCFEKHDVELLVERQVQRVGGQLLVREVKTESSEAPIPLPAIVATALVLALQRRDKLRADATEWDREYPGLVLTTASGRPIEPRNFNRSFAARARKAGVRRIKVHTTRKTCASLLVALDVHPRVAMQVLRHSQISVTMNIYAEVSSKESREALKRLGRTLGGKAGENTP